MLLITFVELRVVAGRSRTRAGRPHAVSGRKENSANYKYALPFFTYLLLNNQPDQEKVLNNLLMPVRLLPGTYNTDNRS
jgi:hypothetical protein